MRGRAYGSDEAENWPQRKTESEGERKRSHKERQAEKERLRERGKENKRGRRVEGKAATRNTGLYKWGSVHALLQLTVSGV